MSNETEKEEYRKNQ